MRTILLSMVSIPYIGKGEGTDHPVAWIIALVSIPYIGKGDNKHIGGTYVSEN